MAKKNTPEADKSPAEDSTVEEPAAPDRPRKTASEISWDRQGIEMDESLMRAMEEANDGRCSICGRTPEEVAAKLKELDVDEVAAELKELGVKKFAGKVKRLSVDHDHTSKKTRGILCQPCNLAIGLFQDNPERMRVAAEYVETFYGFEVLDPHDPRPLDDSPARHSVENYLKWQRSRSSASSTDPPGARDKPQGDAN